MIEINDSSLKTVKTLPGLFEAMRENRDSAWLSEEEMYPIAVPEPTDPSFPDALRHRVAGLVRLLEHVHNFQRHGKDTGATLRAVAQLTRSTDDGTLPRDLPWEGDNGRVAVLRKRAKNLEQGYKIPSLRAENTRLYGKLCELYGLLSLSSHLDDVFRAFGETLSRLTSDPYAEAHWRNVLYNKLRRVDATNVPQEATGLGVLASDLQNASTIVTFRNVINNFRPLVS